MELDKTAETPALPPPQPQQEPTPQLSDAALTKRILVMEDNAVCQRIMTKLLKNLGIENFDIAENGKVGVDMVKAGPSTYSLVLMDTSMPVMGGLEATNVIRDMGVDVPIVAMTAHVMRNDRESFLNRGFNDYMAKPMRIAPLRQMLVKWLD